MSPAHAPWMTGGAPPVTSRGTLRGIEPEETWARLRPLLAARGVTRVADLTDLDVLGIPVWSAIRPGAATLVASAGKGLTHCAARISAVVESLEVAVAEEASVPVVHRGSAARLTPGYSVSELSLHPASLADDRTELEWTEGWDLVSGKAAPVPAAAVGLRGWAHDGWQPPLFVTTTNGLAGGNDHVEAALHGLLELVERDSLARWKPGDGVRVAPERLGPRLGPVWERVRATGAELILERIPSVPGTWTYTCWLVQPEMWQVFGGSGCHTVAAIAAERALMEAVQSRGSTISGARDDIPDWSFRRSGPAPRPPLGPTGEQEELPRQDPPVRPLGEVLDGVVESVHACTGRPVMAVDLTPPAAPWPPVVQVFAPGLGLSLDHPRPRELTSRSFV
ncbi:YcaO-like family protein [Streptomyces sp. NPDC006976]|uniref:YcaO-like family protein n=1 Tax=Streptomyces sp. NPDC006976 TaxID=3154311 RepID=UPI0033FD300D